MKSSSDAKRFCPTKAALLESQHVSALNGVAGTRRKYIRADGKRIPFCGYVPCGVPVRLMVTHMQRTYTDWLGWRIPTARRYAVGYAVCGGAQLSWRAGGLSWGYRYTRTQYVGAAPDRLVWVVRVKTGKVVKRFYTMEGAEKWLQKKSA